MERRILVTDDDASVRYVICQALKRLGNSYQIVAAGDAREALKLMAETPFDLIISDLRLPGMNGIRFTEIARKQGPDTPIIWMTGHGCYSVNKDAQRLGVCTCLDKPITLGTIRQAAQVALATHPEGRKTPPIAQVLSKDHTHHPSVAQTFQVAKVDLTC